VRRDVLEVAPTAVVVPEGAPPVVARSVVTGEGFVPRLGR
jgi:hypothetical protein